jgi:hypothetical protein
MSQGENLRKYVLLSLWMQQKQQAMAVQPERLCAKWNGQANGSMGAVCGMTWCGVVKAEIKFMGRVICTAEEIEKQS